MDQIDSIQFTYGPAQTFVLDVKERTQSSISVHVTPSNRYASYYVSVDNKTHFDEILGGEEAFLEHKLQFIRTMAGVNKMTLEEYLDQELKRDTITYVERNLYSDTEYYVCVFGLNNDGTVTSGVSRQATSTKKMNYTGEVTFDVSVEEVTSRAIQVHVIPSDNSISYYVGYMTAENYAGYEHDEDVVADLIFDAELWGMDWSDPQNTYRGEQRVPLSDLESDTEYKVLVFGINSDGEATTPSTLLSAKTL